LIYVRYLSWGKVGETNVERGQVENVQFEKLSGVARRLRKLGLKDIIKD
jgi:hypothetical protein